MSGPCLCGDPGCGRCFPAGQTPMVCPRCGWKGKSADVGWISQHSSEQDLDDGCPECGTVVVEDLEPCPECGTIAIELECEHDFQEQPGVPPRDVCSRCGEVRE